jgi:hypothetical protein
LSGPSSFSCYSGAATTQSCLLGGFSPGVEFVQFGGWADAERPEKVSRWSVCSAASDAAVQRSQAAGETDKQAEPHQGE